MEGWFYGTWRGGGCGDIKAVAYSVFVCGGGGRGRVRWVPREPKWVGHTTTISYPIDGYTEVPYISRLAKCVLGVVKIAF